MAENGFLGTYVATQIANCILGKSSQFGVGGSAYLTILSEMPKLDGSNISDLEPTTNSSKLSYYGYKRELIGNYQVSVTQLFAMDSELSVDGKIVYKNTKQIKFDKVTDTLVNSYGKSTFTHFAVMSSETGGTLLFTGTLTTPITVTANQSINIAVGDAVITIE